MSALDHLLPHRGTALMLQSAVLESGSVIATAMVAGAHPLSDGTSVPAFVGLELGAQAAAALEGLTTEGEIAREGRLVRIRGAEFLQPVVPVETTLTVRATPRGMAPPVALYSIEVRYADAVIVRGEITTYRGTGADGTQ